MYLTPKPKEIAIARIKAGYGTVKLSKITGINQTTHIYIEQGKCKTTRPDTAKKIADALGCTIEDLFEIKEGE